MGDSSNYVTLLLEIKKISSNIIQRALPMMEDICNEEISEYIEMYLDENPSLDPAKIQNVLQTITTEWIADAESAQNEIAALLTSPTEEDFRLKIENLSFFSQIWKGDTYDLEELQGLEAFIADLKTQLANVTEKNLLARADAILLVQ